METRSRREWTVEEYDKWATADRNVADVNEACAEEGGPRVSLVPDPVSVPFEILPDASHSVPALAGAEAVPFTPQPSRRIVGWSAVRQRMFIEALAETGSIHLSAKAAGLSARSAYALRVRSAHFAAAWDAAQQLAVGRLSALAFDRAIHGRIDQYYRDGELVGEKRVPSDRLLMWLLSRLDPRRFAFPWERGKDDASDPQADAQQAFPAMLLALSDTPAD